MKVILLQDVAKVGQRGSIVQVKSGFAQNFLFPRRLAETATKAKEAATVKLQKERAEAHAAQLEALQKALSSLKGSLKIAAKANEQGHLFEGINAGKVAEALSEVVGLDVPEDAVTLSQSIKEVGKHEVRVVIDEWKGAISVEVAAG